MDPRVVHATHVALQSAARTLAADVERLRILAELTYLRECLREETERDAQYSMSLSVDRIRRLEAALWGE